MTRGTPTLPYAQTSLLNGNDVRVQRLPARVNLDFLVRESVLEHLPRALSFGRAQFAPIVQRKNLALVGPSLA